MAGFAADRFVFEGFLPARAVARRERLARLATETRTLVFYEAPHRLLASLGDMVAVFGGDREAVLARELSKLYETVRRASLAELLSLAHDEPQQQRGEIVLVVAGGVAEDAAGGLSGIDADELLDTLLEELPPRRAAALAARITGGRRNDFYERALARRRAREEG